MNSLIVWISTTAILVGCTGRQENAPPKPPSSTKQLVAPMLPIQQSFTVELPNGPSWQTVNEGPLPGVDDSHLVSIVDSERQISINVMVLPTLPNQPSMKELVPEWEAGLLTKMSRKKSSEFTTLSGHEAYKIVAALDLPDGKSLDAVSIITSAYGRDFTVGFMAPTDLVSSVPEIETFLNSFRITPPAGSER